MINGAVPSDKYERKKLAYAAEMGVPVGFLVQMLIVMAGTRPITA